MNQLVLMMEFCSFYLRRIRQCQEPGARKLEHCAAAAHLRSALSLERDVRSRITDRRLVGNMIQRLSPELMPGNLWQDFITPKLCANDPVARRLLRAKS